MPIPTELVGSLPRPMKLQQAYADHDEGKITWEQLQAEQDAAAEDSIRRLEETGEPIVTDGEQRESSFATYPITHTLAGTGLAENLAGDGQFFAIFDDGHHRQLPRLTGGPFRYQTYASEFVEKNVKIATHPVKQAVISPSMMMLLYPLEAEIRRLFARAVPRRPRRRVREGHPQVLRRRRRARVDRLHRGPAGEQERLAQSMDRARTCCRSSSTSTIACSTASRAEERRNIGIHTCPGGDCDSVHSKEVPYELLLEHMFDMNAGYFLIQCESEDDRESVYKLCGQYSREDADGVPQVCFMGVINPLTPEVETPEQVRDELLTAAKYIPVEPPRRHRRLRLLAVQPRRQAEARLARLRPRRRDAEDLRATRGRAPGVGRTLSGGDAVDFATLRVIRLGARDSPRTVRSGGVRLRPAGLSPVRAASSGRGRAPRW